MLISILVLLLIDIGLHVYELYAKQVIIRRINITDSVRKVVPYLKCESCKRELPDVIKMPDGRVACSQCRARVFNSV